MNESRQIKIVYPNGSSKLVQISPRDIPINLAQPCDFLNGDVFMIHNGHYLSPYLSIEFQNVGDGDVIYFAPKKANTHYLSLRESKKKASTRKISSKLPTKNKGTRGHHANKEMHESIIITDRDEQIAREKSQEIFEEILRISDIQFRPYETSPYGALAYQQLANETQILNSVDDDNYTGNESENEYCDNFDPQNKTDLTKDPSNQISNEPLPVLWTSTNEADDNLDSGDQARMNQMHNFHDRSIPDTSSSIDH